ncbi:MAG: undecaprenyl-diphosphatase UppP [Candidatus Anoxymicrobium japonicum]|uniref:Undecaprenyl-diphosphatase n=1 Tax=Candidatus Anoxymicrobium japonicum TaxID=2013648 RepID=A0A2N3G4T4_9ACTN|nr:MAG: undecaprenyl-diphosphatase UppP [Candidatus Anoxymicrobium japonicum]
MIPALQAAFLGMIQGMTEFVPVSSSGHLVLIPRLFGWPDQGMAFDVAVHMGTLLALLVFFRRDWIAVIKGFFRAFKRSPADWDGNMRLAWMLVLASIPAAIAGALLNNVIEENLRTPAWVAVFLLCGAAAMLAAEKMGRGLRGSGELKTRDAVVVGLAQTLALAPGVSRSGITISAGMLDGLNREAAARFAFLMAAPIIAGSGMYEALKLVKNGFPAQGPGVFAAGFAASAITGFFAVNFMLRYLKKRTLTPFIIYRVALAALAFAILALY